MTVKVFKRVREWPNVGSARDFTPSGGAGWYLFQDIEQAGHATVCTALAGPFKTRPEAAVSLVLMFLNIMTYFLGRFPVALAHSRAGGADAAPEPIRHRVEQGRTGGARCQDPEVYVPTSRCHQRLDRPAVLR